METEAVRLCGICLKEVAEANFTLHEMHCKRFLCLCPDCNEPIPREHLSQHREEQHTQVRCSKCNKKMDRCDLQDHESDECVERIQSCQFCNLQLPWKKLAEHHHFCGSRTERCQECGCYVTLRDQPEHSSTCSTSDNVPAPPRATSKPPPNTHIRVRCKRCMGLFPAEDMRTHELECVSAARLDREEDKPQQKERDAEGDVSTHRATSRLSSSYKATSLSDRSSSGPWGDGGDPDQISTCPHCHLALPLLTLRWHKVKCQIHILMK